MNQSIRQYLVMLYSGQYESRSIANVSLFYLTEEERNPTQVADLLDNVFKEYLKEESRYPIEDAESIRNFLSLINDTLPIELYEFMEYNNFHFSPQNLPIEKIISLSESIDYFTDREDWYFKKDNIKNNQVSIFDVIWENNFVPKFLTLPKLLP